MGDLSSDLVGGNSLFGLSYELAADNIPLLVVALAAVTILFLLFRLKPINIPAVVLYVFSVVGVSLDLIQQFSGNKISSVYLPEWFIFLIGQLSYSILIGIGIWFVFSYYYEKKRTAICKRRLLVAYDYLKKKIIETLLTGCEERYDSDIVKEFFDSNKFLDYFGEDNSKRWYRFANQLDDEHSTSRHDLIIAYEVFGKEISNALNANISINEESYNRLCHMSVYITSIKLKYDSIISQKTHFDNFDKQFIEMNIWYFLAGWHLADSQSTEDAIKEAIQRI